MEASGKLQRSNNKCLWPECLVEAAAGDLKHFKGLRGFKAGKRYNKGLWRQTAGCNALTTEGYGGKREAATLEQHMLVARVLGGSCRQGF